MLKRFQIPDLNDGTSWRGGRLCGKILKHVWIVPNGLLLQQVQKLHDCFCLLHETSHQWEKLMSSQSPADLWLCVTRQSGSWCADTTDEQTSSCQLSQKTHRHAQTHYRPFKYTYSPNIHRTTFIKQLPHRIWMHSAIHQWAHSSLLIVTNNESASARTADTDTRAFRM